MKTLFLVKQEEADLARSMEQKLLRAAKKSGVLFVSVTVSPANNEKPRPVYQVFLGCDRNTDPRTMDALIRFLLLEEVQKGVELETVVRQGSVSQ